MIDKRKLKILKCSVLSLPSLIWVNIALWPEAVLTDEGDVREYLGQLATHKSLGVDGVYLRVLWELSDVIVRLFTFLLSLRAHNYQDKLFVTRQRQISQPFLRRTRRRVLRVTIFSHSFQSIKDQILLEAVYSHMKDKK